MTVITESTQMIVVGVDTHQRTHHAVVLDHTGKRLADREIPVTERGYAALLDWASGFGLIDRFGIESTGSYGAGLTRFLVAAGIEVIEVNYPDLVTRARQGKSDPIDAEAAARAVLSGRASGRPKLTSGTVESIRVLKISRDSAVKDRSAAFSMLRDIITTAPSELRETLLPLSPAARVKVASAFHPDLASVSDPEHAARYATRRLALRIQSLNEEIRDTDKVLDELVRGVVPTLVAAPQIGTQTAAQLLITAGQNVDRLRNEASFAKLTGVAPLPASSGKSQRMRLNRGGDRQANRALYMIAVGRLKNHPATIAYAQRRQAEGLSRRDVIRCLKRYIARETYNALKKDLDGL